MQSVLKSLGLWVGVLAISGAIFVLVTDNPSIKENVLNSSLELLGKQLLDMLPPDDARAAVEQKWQAFSARASAGEIAPAKVERVAVSILNGRNAKDCLSSADAAFLLDFALADSAENFAAFLSATGEHSWPEVRLVPAPPPRSAVHSQPNPALTVTEPPQGVEDLGAKIEALCKFSEALHKSALKHTTGLRDIDRHFYYKFHDGIKIDIDESLRQRLRDARLADCSNQLNLFERHKMVDSEIERASELLELEAGKLEEWEKRWESIAPEHSKAIHLAGDESLQHLKTLEKLHRLRVIPEDELRSILKSVLPNSMPFDTGSGSQPEAVDRQPGR